MRTKSLTLQIFFLGLVLLTGCLPAQKKTQCGENEAFDPTRRSCVPALGANSSSSVFVVRRSPSNSYNSNLTNAPITHSINVSDAYQYGYSTRWVLSYVNGSTTFNDTTVATNTLSFTFNPNDFYGLGNYTLEAQVLEEDANNVIDSTSWSIIVDTNATATISSTVPAGNAATFTNDVTSTTVTALISNPDGASGSFEWFLNGISQQTASYSASTTSDSFTFDPSSLVAGLSTLEFVIYNATSDVVDSKVWTVLVNDPDLPMIDTTDPDYLYTLVAIDGQSIGGGGFSFFDGTSFTTFSNLCVTVDNWDKNSDTISDADLLFEVNGNIIRGATVVTSTLEVCLDTPAYTETLANPDIGVSKTLTAKLFKRGTTQLIDFRQWSLNVRPTNIAPQIAIRSTSPYATEPSCTQDTLLSWSDCVYGTQVVDVNGNGSYEEASVDYFEDTTVVATEPGSLQTFSFEITYDPDIDNNDDFQVVFQLKRDTDANYFDLDGSTNPYSRSDCVHDYTEVLAPALTVDTNSSYSAKLTCDLAIEAFGASGPIDPGTFNLRAYITDNGTPNKESNRVQWTIDVTESQLNDLRIAAQGTTPATTSVISDYDTDSTCTGANTALPATPGARVDEGEYVGVSVLVRDIERDNLELSATLTSANGSFSSEVIPRFTITKDDATLAETIDPASFTQMCFQVPDWATTGGNGTATLTVTVRDIPSTATPVSPAAELVMTFGVTNVNPTPYFTGFLGSDGGSSNSFDGSSVVAGFPVTINTPTPLDQSTSDGNTINWQWQVSLDPDVVTPTWTNIPGADKTSLGGLTTLVWTPPLSLSDSRVALRLCLGDDGGNNLPVSGTADCASTQSSYTIDNITVLAASIDSTSSLANAPSGSQMASWYDEQEGFLYMAYTEGTNIHVEKYSTGPNGELLTSTNSLVFATDATPANAVAATDLSMTGVNFDAGVGDGVSDVSLYIAYKVQNNVSGYPEIRVRKIRSYNNDVDYTGSAANINTMSFDYNGLYLGPADTTDVFDLFNTTAGNEITVASVDTETITLTIANVGDWGTGDGVSFTIDGTPYDIDYGDEFCTGACGNEATIATELAAAINISTDVNHRIRVEDVTGAVITLSGYNQGDSYNNNSKIASVVGNIVTDGTDWFLPYLDAVKSNRVEMISAATGQEASLAGEPINETINLGTNSFNQEVRAIMSSSNTSIYLATKSSSANVDLYQVNTATRSITDSTTSIFPNATNVNEISNIKIAISSNGSDETNDTVYIAGKAQTSIGSFIALSAHDGDDISDYFANTTFGRVSVPDTRFDYIDQLDIIGDSNEPDTILMALSYPSVNPSTSLAHEFADSLYLKRLEISNADAPSNAGVTFSFNDQGTLLNPDLPTLSGGVISLAAIEESATKGDAGNSAGENVKDTLMMFFHVDNSGTYVIKAGQYNIEPAGISATANSTGSSQAIIPAP